MFRVLSITALVFVFCTNANAENSLSTSVKPGILAGKSWTVAIGYSPTSTKFTHSAVLSDARVDGLGSDTQVSNNEISLRMMKEFYDTQRFSFSLLASAAYLTGSANDTTDQDISFTQRLDGYQIGAGLSANANFYKMGFGIQPYIATEFFSDSANYELDYRSNDIPVLISNRVSTILFQPSIGIRVFDPQTSIMSYLAVGASQNLSASATSQLDVSSEGASGIANPELIEASAMFVRIGFGFFF